MRRAAKAAGLPLMEAAFNISRTLLIADSERPWPPAEDPLTVRPALVFDCDGILSFTAEGMCAALNARFGTSYNPMSQGFFPGTLRPDRLPAGQADWLRGLMREDAFWTALAPDFHALDTLRDAYSAGMDVRVATERDPALQKVTQVWLEGWGAPPVDVAAVGHGNKPAWLRERYGPDRPCVLIDDNWLATVTVPGPGISLWLPERPYTDGHLRTGCRRFGSWAEVRWWLGLGPAA